MEDIIKIIKSINDSGLLTKGVNEEAIKSEAKPHNGRFTRMRLENLGDNLLGNRLAGKGTSTAGKGTTGAGEKF